MTIILIYFLGMAVTIALPFLSRDIYDFIITDSFFNEEPTRICIIIFWFLFIPIIFLFVLVDFLEELLEKRWDKK